MFFYSAAWHKSTAHLKLNARVWSRCVPCFPGLNHEWEVHQTYDEHCGEPPSEKETFSETGDASEVRNFVFTIARNLTLFGAPSQSRNVHQRIAENVY